MSQLDWVLSSYHLNISLNLPIRTPHTHVTTNCNLVFSLRSTMLLLLRVTSHSLDEHLNFRLMCLGENKMVLAPVEPLVRLDL